LDAGDLKKTVECIKSEMTSARFQTNQLQIKFQKHFGHTNPPWYSHPGVPQRLDVEFE